MAAHGELARSRPAAAHLTGFYVSLSAGGMIGGLFAGLIAPNVFSSVAEYPDPAGAGGIVPAHSIRRLERARARDLGARDLAACWLIAPRLLIGWVPNDDQIGLCELGRDRRRGSGRGADVGGAADECGDGGRGGARRDPAITRLMSSGCTSVRSFFGVHKVCDTRDGKLRAVEHGTTIHGAERLLGRRWPAPAKPPEPLTYYYFRFAHGPDHARRACAQGRHAQCRGDRARLRNARLLFPARRELALFRDRSFDRYGILRATFRGSAISAMAPPTSHRFRRRAADAGARARSSLRRDRRRCLSSDAIPIHLATREAMAIYKAKLAPRKA